jgi:hypothetical protein
MRLAQFIFGAACACNLIIGQVTAPITGFVVDQRSQAVRPIIGIPGASVLGDSVSLGLPIKDMAYGTGADLGMAIDAVSGRAVVISGLRAGQAALKSLDTTFAPVTMFALNAAGTAGVIYSQDLRQVQFINQLLDAPQASEPITLSVPGELLSIAVDGSGKLALLGFQDSGGGFVYRLRSEATANPVLITQAGIPQAIKFAADDASAIVACGGTNEIVRIEGVTDTPVTSALFSFSDGVDDPVALYQEPTGRVLVANRGSLTLIELDFDNRSASVRFDLVSAPTRIAPLVRGVFVLNEVGANPLLLLDNAADNRRVVFVPMD